jgi:hypothetical protein
VAEYQRLRVTKAGPKKIKETKLMEPIEEPHKRIEAAFDVLFESLHKISSAPDLGEAKKTAFHTLIVVKNLLESGRIFNETEILQEMLKMWTDFQIERTHKALEN